MHLERQVLHAKMSRFRDKCKYDNFTFTPAGHPILYQVAFHSPQIVEKRRKIEEIVEKCLKIENIWV